MDRTAAGFAIVGSLGCDRPGAGRASQQAFEAAAKRGGCPVSKVLKAEITMDAKLEI
jgi:hypothetical protein